MYDRVGEQLKIYKEFKTIRDILIAKEIREEALQLESTMDKLFRSIYKELNNATRSRS